MDWKLVLKLPLRIIFKGQPLWLPFDFQLFINCFKKYLKILQDRAAFLIVLLSFYLHAHAYVK